MRKREGKKETKEVKELYNENYKTLKKEIGQDTSPWKNLPCSWILRINAMKIMAQEGRSWILGTMAHRTVGEFLYAFIK
jgi:hypothetical protein